jgi:hypothetical protein
MDFAFAKAFISVWIEEGIAKMCRVVRDRCVRLL